MEEFLRKAMPPDASAHGPHLDHIIVLVHWLMAVLFVGWALYFLYTLYRFRAGRHPRASYEGTKSKVSTVSEVSVIAAEVVLLAGFSIPAWSRWVTPPPPSARAQEIRVIGEQFGWNVIYPGPDGIFGRRDVKLVSPTNPVGIDPNDPHSRDDVATINQLHLEVNRPVVIHLSSKDVIHSFFLPVMRVKQDVIPGMDIPIHFTPVKINRGQRWEIACAQLCGLGHYRMRGQLVVESGKELQAWLAQNATAAQ